MAYQEEVKKHPFIERIYVTIGDNGYNENNHKCDKAIGLGINNRIIWINESFAYLSQLSGILDRLDIHVNYKGKWGVWQGKTVYTPNRLTRITLHHDDIFNDDSYYMKKTYPNPKGEFLSWSIDDVLTAFDKDNELGHNRIHSSLQA